MGCIDSKKPLEAEISDDVLRHTAGHKAVPDLALTCPVPCLTGASFVSLGFHICIYDSDDDQGDNDIGFVRMCQENRIKLYAGCLSLRGRSWC